MHSLDMTSNVGLNAMPVSLPLSEGADAASRPRFELRGRAPRSHKGVETVYRLRSQYTTSTTAEGAAAPELDIWCMCMCT